MAVNEQIVTGRKFRKLIDETTKLWQRISFWTKSSDVEFDDGKDAETKLGAINGITSDLSCEESTIAASAAALNQVNRSLGGCTLKKEGNDFYIVGADSVSKKLGNSLQIINLPASTTIYVSNYYADYKSLTVNNFAVEAQAVASTTGLSLNGLTGASCNFSTGYAFLNKSYNATTGVLTISSSNNSGSKNPVGTTGGGVISTQVSVSIRSVKLFV